MTPQKKNEYTAVLKKAYEITPISKPLNSAYTKDEVIQIIELDRRKVAETYADFLRRISIK